MTQRVIKFRCWEPSTKKMHYNLTFISNDGGAVMGADRPLIGGIILQFTGLLDKHGKEIYEGDIRKEMLDGLFVGDPQREHYFVMVYIQEWTMFAWLSITSGEYEEYLKEGAEALDTEMYWTYPAGQDEPNNVELVGNIYTTPELIER